VAPHTYGEQLVDPPAAQVPLPLHVPPFVWRLPEQLVAPHAVPEAYFWQPPAPSHFPSVPQLVAPWSEHEAFGAPATMGPQVPFDPLPLMATLHAWQVPPHAWSQHTPSVQKPVAHWLAPPHTAPWPSLGTHDPALHHFVEPHIASVVQFEAQTAPAHGKGAHDVVVPALQFPDPSHVDALVSVPAVQEPARHVAPAG